MTRCVPMIDNISTAPNPNLSGMLATTLSISATRMHRVDDSPCKWEQSLLRPSCACVSAVWTTHLYQENTHAHASQNKPICQAISRFPCKGGERLPDPWLRAAGPLCAFWNATVLFNSYGLLRPTNVGARLCACTFNKQVEHTYM